MRTYSFTVNNIEYTLKYGFNALVGLEETLKKPISSFADGQIGFKEIRAIIHAGLKHEHNSITLEKVGQIIDDYIEEKPLEELIQNAVTLIGNSIKAK